MSAWIGHRQYSAETDLARTAARNESSIDLSRALDELQELNPVKAQAVELRCLLGCTIKETAVLLDSAFRFDRDIRFRPMIVPPLMVISSRRSPCGQPARRLKGLDPNRNKRGSVLLGMGWNQGSRSNFDRGILELISPAEAATPAGSIE
jgi:hypothetical protein